MHFNRATLPPHVILQFPSGGVEGVANRDIDILMGAMFAGAMILDQIVFDLPRFRSTWLHSTVWAHG